MGRMKHQAIVATSATSTTRSTWPAWRRPPGITRTTVKPQVDEWQFPDGHSIIVLSEGRLMNLGNATGHPSFVMSELVHQPDDRPDRAVDEDRATTSGGVYVLPKLLDEKVARLHLDALGVKLTELRPGAGRLHRGAGRRPVQARPLPLLDRDFSEPAPAGCASKVRAEGGQRDVPTPIRIDVADLGLPRRVRRGSSGPIGRCRCSRRSASGSPRSGRSRVRGSPSAST